MQHTETMENILNLQTLKINYNKKNTKDTSKMSLLELKELKFNLENELSSLEKIITVFYTKDYNLMNVINDNLTRVKTHENYTQYYDIMYEIFLKAKKNTTTICNDKYVNSVITSKYCLAILDKIYYYETQKCNTTNIIKYHITDIKDYIKKINRLMK